MGASHSNLVLASDHENATVHDLYTTVLLTAQPGAYVSLRDFFQNLLTQLAGQPDSPDETEFTRTLHRMLNDVNNPIVLLRAPTQRQREDALRLLQVSLAAFVPAPPAVAPAAPAAAAGLPVPPAAAAGRPAGGPRVPPTAAVPPAAAAPPAAAVPPVAAPAADPRPPRVGISALREMIANSREIHPSLIRLTRNHLHAEASDSHGRFLTDNQGVLEHSGNRAQAFRMYFGHYINTARRPAPARYIVVIHILELYFRQCGCSVQEWQDLMRYQGIRRALDRIWNRIPAIADDDDDGSN